MYYSSYSLSKNLVYNLILAIQILLVHSVLSLNLTNEYLSYKCFESEGKYKPGSEYEENLNSLTRALYNSKFIEGYRILGKGKAPNLVFVTLQCRGDSYSSYCSSCFATAVDGLRRRCQSYKRAAIWYDQCFLGITPFKSTPLKFDNKNTFAMQNPNNLKGDTKSFNKRTKDFLNELMLKAYKGVEPDGGLTFYAAGEKMIGTQKLYAMAQCNHNMLLCKECLEWSIEKITKCCSGKQGARFYGTSCFIRYELYPFLRTK